MNNIDAKITAWQLGPVTIMRGTATPGRDVTHPECFGRFTVVALSYGGAIRKCMRRVAQMCAKHSACEQSSTGRRHGRESHRRRQEDHRGMARQGRAAGRDRAIPAHPHRRGEGHHPASPPGTRAGKPAGIGDNRRES